MVTSGGLVQCCNSVEERTTGGVSKHDVHKAQFGLAVKLGGGLYCHLSVHSLDKVRNQRRAVPRPVVVCWGVPLGCLMPST